MIVVPVSDVNPMAIADSGASHMILPQTALCDTKAAKPVSLRLSAGEITAVVVTQRDLCRAHHNTTVPIRTCHSETPAYCDLDTPDFDSELCDQVGSGTRPYALYWHAPWPKWDADVFIGVKQKDRKTA